MAEDALKIISLVFGGAPARTLGPIMIMMPLILVDLTVGDRPAEMSEMTCAKSSKVQRRAVKS